MTIDPSAAAAYVDAHFEDFLAILKDLTRIPSVSADAGATGEVRRSAEAVRDAMRAAGLEHCEILELAGAHPYVYADWLHAAGKPTLLLYAHHDVQPPGRPGHWRTPPFEPTWGKDGRLYARGIVDDKAGVVSHLAAVKAYLATAGALPVNVKIIIEGEEEIGSDHLSAFLAAHKDKLRADVMVLTDTANLDEGIPSLTYRLRGMTSVFIEVTGLDHPVHSGMWGGPVPDPVQAMAKILASLSDADGVPAVPGLLDQVAPISEAERAALARLPFDRDKFRADAGMTAGAALVGEGGFSVYEQLWLRPSLTVIALEASPVEGSSNQIVPSARARVSVRLVPGMDVDRTTQLLVDHIRKVAPWGVTVTVTPEPGTPAWQCTPEGPAFDAARRALARGYDREVALIGAGGSIPFVGPFAEAFGGAPALLVGLEDPICNAHAENESLNVVDWRKGIKGEVYLFEELATYGRRSTS